MNFCEVQDAIKKWRPDQGEHVCTGTGHTRFGLNYLIGQKEHVGKGRLRSPYGASHILQLKETRPTKCLKAMNDLAARLGLRTLLKEDPRNSEIRMFTVGVGYESKVKHYCSLCTLNTTSFNNSEAALVFYGIHIEKCLGNVANA